MQRRWKRLSIIAAAFLCVLIVFSACFKFSSDTVQDPVPTLSKEEKEFVKMEYYDLKCGGKLETYLRQPIIWYDENGYVEEHHVWRYVGTYGDCYAFLVIGDNWDLWGEITPGEPYGLTRLEKVFYHCEADVYLYHTKTEFTRDGRTTWIAEGNNVRLADIVQINKINLEEWITEEQLEQLREDIKALAPECN